MPKGKRGSHGKPELLEFQLKYRLNRKLFPTAGEQREAIRAARDEFLDSGESIRGVEIVGRWRNPDNRNPRHANWKTTEDSGQSLKEFWQTLHKGRGALGAITALPIPETPEVHKQKLSKIKSTAMRRYHAEIRKIVSRRRVSYAQARAWYRWKVQR